MLQGLLTTKVVHKQDKLTSVNRTHELYTSFVPKERSDSAAAAAASAASTSGGRISISYSYRLGILLSENYRILHQLKCRILEARAFQAVQLCFSAVHR